MAEKTRPRTAVKVLNGQAPDLGELKQGGLGREQLIGIYRNMYMSRRLDDKEIQLKRQNRIYFQISGAGHEAVLTAAAMHLRPGRDWFYPYYRDRALCLQLGMTPKEMLLSAVGGVDDPNSGGRQMPSHWGHKGINIVTQSSPTGTQFLQAVGCAEANRQMEPDSDEVVYVSGGDGSTSEGEFWEALNAACLRRAPVVFLITDNKYAISVRIEAQTAGGSISKIFRSMPGLRVDECDGCDPIASYITMKDAVAHARSRDGGPVLVHAHTIRPYSHSLSDDERLYRPASEREDEDKKDPLRNFAALLVRLKAADEEFLVDIRQEVDQEIDQATQEALGAERARPLEAVTHLYSPSIDPTAAEFDVPPQPQGDPKTMVDLLNACMRDEMARDERIVVFGEDVADLRLGSRLQQPARRGDDRRPRHWHGDPGTEAGDRGAVFRLHLARLHATAQRVRVVYPSNALDANGLLRTAIRCDDPVIFLEHKHLYRQIYNKAPYPGSDHAIPFGVARIVREGSTLTVVTYGALVERTARAAKALAESGIDAEIIDLRTLNPFDWETVAASVRKTGRALVAHEDTLSWGYGAELAARIGDRLFEHLDAPVRRVGALDTWVGYEPGVEKVTLPQINDIQAAMEELAAY
jgi:TPP-dependent pyruvate/acetoin dehydrogenase alpha subunit/pyruvate/2-oxoglutarate/acetoin dehydrogenase E1 component